MEKQTLSNIKRATFALGLYPEAKIEKFIFEKVSFIGTGFLVADNTLVTSFHTATQLGARARAGMGTPVAISMSMDSRGDLAVHVETGLTIVPVPIENRPNAEGLSKYDNIGASIVFTSNLIPERGIPVVGVGNLEKLDDDARIAISGYMHGTTLLAMPHISILRIGPLLSFGYVASINPWSGTPKERVLSFLTDATTGDHLGGAPVVEMTTGTLLGVHCASIHGGRIGISIPMHRRRVDDLILMALRSRHRLDVGKLLRTPQGDLHASSRELLERTLTDAGLTIPTCVGPEYS